MSTERRSVIRLASWSTLAAAVLMHCGVAQAGPLRFCVDKASPSAAMDVRLAQAVGRDRHQPVQVAYYEGLPKGDDKDDFDLRDYKEVLGERCDLVLGFPYDERGGKLPGYLHASKPYASTGFVLVTPHHSRYATLEAMPQGTHLAVSYNTLANYYFRRHKNVAPNIEADDADSLSAIGRHEVAGALLWRPGVAEQIEKRHAPADLELHELGEPDSRWNLIALYGTNNDAAQAFDSAIEAMRGSGELARTLGRYADVELTGAAAGTATKGGGLGDLSLAADASPSACAGKPLAAPPALFTDTQAATGKAVFSDKCALCHGPNLEGRAGPALKGKLFLPAKAGHTVADIFQIVSQNMPATLPGSLSHDDYVNIMAFLLQENGYPGGSNPLTFDIAKSSKTPMVYRGQ